jgi:hypothetical protein
LPIPKLTGRINSFLHVGILTLKLFNFPFDHILHKVLLLSHVLIFDYLIGFGVSWLEVEGVLWVAVKSVVSDYLMACVWKLRW